LVGDEEIVLEDLLFSLVARNGSRVDVVIGVNFA
jgi:hypothetical protein